MSHPLLLYDGVCGLCNQLVQFILRRDPGGVFRFAALQSALAGRILARRGVNATDLDTVYVVVNSGQADEELLSWSDAVIFILMHVGVAELRSTGQPGAAVPTQAKPTPATPAPRGPTFGYSFWRFIGLLLQLVPRRVRDWGYRVVARSRYRIFGRYDTCPVPSEDTRWRFLDL